ncbi:MAG: mandelate racemase/muconate lactonizing enzyme family protein [Phycisphaerae bacterium]|nr:mandelate racemase/muconate lactonizing enzyme family protein [Phycisphaerae bacterium]
MKIEAVDWFYLSMPEILDIGDGSQDALLVRLRAGGFEGWGECEAAPLVSIASWICPMSHSACKPVCDSVLGQRLESAADIQRIGERVRRNSFDLLQADHTLSGIDIAMWDLLGKKTGRPVYELLGYPRAYPKTPYASALFANNAQATLNKAREYAARGYAAVKFGWGPFGTGNLRDDEDQLHAAREGLGPDRILLVDAGTVWIDRVEEALLRLPALRECRATWLEEPFVCGALGAYARLARQSDPVRLAGGEGAHNDYMAKNMLDLAGLGFVQIDTGRIGGITPAKLVADYADARGVVFVNHTFTTHLALSASLQPFAGLQRHQLCEYPVEPKPLARELTAAALLPDHNGQIHLPQSPGLGIAPDPAAIRRYLVDVEIKAKGQVLYRTPEV